MKPITKAQRKAIHRIFNRHRPIDGEITAQELLRQAGWRFIMDLTTDEWCWYHPHYGEKVQDPDEIAIEMGYAKRLSYREFRRTVMHGFDCLMVNVSGMWIGIEKDGYTHT